MDSLQFMPKANISSKGIISTELLKINNTEFSQAAKFVHKFPYKYNTNYADPLKLFKEGRGSCSSKHAVIGGLAKELAKSYLP